MREAGVQNKQIAVDFGIHSTTVSTILNGKIWKHLGLDKTIRTNKRLNIKELDEVKHLLVEGKTRQEIAAKFGVSVTTILRIDNKQKERGNSL
jgi:DNA-binding CsgD family transcriptional regulator